MQRKRELGTYPRMRGKKRIARKSELDKIKGFYGKALIDGIEVDVANWLVEPPGLFMVEVSILKGENGNHESLLMK